MRAKFCTPPVKNDEVPETFSDLDLPDGSENQAFTYRVGYSLQEFARNSCTRMPAITGFGLFLQKPLYGTSEVVQGLDFRLATFASCSGLTYCSCLRPELERCQRQYATGLARY